jgi:hypothetical protein
MPPSRALGATRERPSSISTRPNLAAYFPGWSVSTEETAGRLRARDAAPAQSSTPGPRPKWRSAPQPLPTTPPACEPACEPCHLLRNGSRRNRWRSKLPQSDQHRQCPLKLAIQVNLIPGGHLESLGPIRGAERLFPDRVAVLKLGDRVFEPFLPMSAQPRLQCFGCRLIRPVTVGCFFETFQPMRTGVAS